MTGVILIGIAIFMLLLLQGALNHAPVPNVDDDSDDDLWTNPDRWLDRGESHPPGRDDWYGHD